MGNEDGYGEMALRRNSGGAASEPRRERENERRGRRVIIDLNRRREERGSGLGGAGLGRAAGQVLAGSGVRRAVAGAARGRVPAARRFPGRRVRRSALATAPLIGVGFGRDRRGRHRSGNVRRCRANGPARQELADAHARRREQRQSDQEKDQGPHGDSPRTRGAFGNLVSVQPDNESGQLNLV